MQLATDISQSINQRTLDVHVDVFQFLPELEVASLNLRFDLAERPFNLDSFVFRHDAGGGQHLGMRNRTADVLRVKPAIKADAFGERLDATIRRLLEYSAPRGARQGCLFRFHQRQ